MIALFLALLIQVGFSQSPPAAKPQEMPAELLTDPSATPKPVPDLVTGPQTPIFADDYSYDPTGRRDPFIPPKSFLHETGKQGAIIRPKTQSPISESADPLQRLDLERASLVGIIWEVANPRAMLIDNADPTKTVFVLQRKTKVGRNNGYVSAIREGEVVIIESFDEDGVINQIPRVLTLRKDQK